MTKEQLPNNNISIPVEFFNIKYNGNMIPSSNYDRQLKTGANCQLFAYTFLHYFGFPMLEFRSSDLWYDQKYTLKVNKMKPFDLVLFNKTNTPYGAHVGVCISHDKILHLSKQVGYPTVWNIETFKNDVKYKEIVGIKRLKKQSQS